MEIARLNNIVTQLSGSLEPQTVSNINKTDNRNIKTGLAPDDTWKEEARYTVSTTIAPVKALVAPPSNSVNRQPEAVTTSASAIQGKTSESKSIIGN